MRRTRHARGLAQGGRRVENIKVRIGVIVLAAIVALILVTLLTSVIKTVIEVAIVVGAVYLIARLMMKKK